MTRLDYQTPATANRTDWPPLLVIALVGVPIGVCVMFTSYAIVFFGAIGSIFIGCMTAYAARTRPFAFALLGGWAVGLSTFVPAGVWAVFSGRGLHDLIVVSIVFVPLVFVLPALIGCTIIVWSGVRAG